MKIRVHLSSGLFVLTAAIFALSGALHAQDYYTVTFIGRLPGQISATGAGINNLGHVCGSSGNKAFFWSPESGIVELPALAPRTDAIAYDINNNDVVAGTSGIDFLGPQANRAVRWTNGVVENLGTLPGGSRSQGYAINDSGWVVGYGHYYLNGNEYWRPTFYRDGFGMDTLSGVTGGYAYDVSNLGQIVGLGSPAAFYWTVAAGATYLTGPSGWVTSSAGAISPDGVWVGGTLINSSGNLRYFARWSEGTGWQMYSGLNNSGVTAIRTNGDWVGSSSAITTGFLYTGAAGLHDVNDYIDPASGWVITLATDINELGQITGRGLNTITGEAGALLLTPPPQPPAAVDDLTINVQSGSVSLNWSPVLGAARYLVYGADVAVFTPAPENLLTTTTATSTMFPVDAAQKFYLVIVQAP